MCQANSILNPEDLHFQKNRFYGSPRSKRSPNEIESEINESSVDNNGSKCVDNRENTQIENILTPNNSMINIDEIVNDFYFNEEIFEQWIGNWCTQYPYAITKYSNSDISNKNGKNFDNERKWQQSSNDEEEIFSELQPIENYEDIRTPIDFVNCHNEPVGKCFRSELPNDKCTDEWQCQSYNKNIAIYSVVNVYFPMNIF